MSVSIEDFGAKETADNNAVAIQKAIDSLTNGGTVEIPAGTWVSGTLQLKPNVRLHLDHGAVLKGSPRMADYPDTGLYHNELGKVKGLIYAKDAENITIDGDGLIDYNGLGFFDFTRPNNPVLDYSNYSDDQKKQFAVKFTERPTSMMFLQHCPGLNIKDVHVKDAASWDIVLTACDHVKIVNLTISSNQRIPNDDGTHLCGCRDVVIANCDLQTGDDCIAITNITDWERETRNITVTNCVLSSSSTGIRIGYWRSKIDHVQISNCTISDSSRGVLINANNAGYVRNVMINQLSYVGRPHAGAWWGNGEAIYVNAVPYKLDSQTDHQFDQADVFPNVQNVRVTHLNAISNIGIVMVGDKKNIQDFTIADADITMINSVNRDVLGDDISLSPIQRDIKVPEGAEYWLYAEEVKDSQVTGVKVHNRLQQPLTQVEQKVVKCDHLRVDATYCD